MAMLTVWRFDTADAAEQASLVLRELARDGVVVIQDAATVDWQKGSSRPATHQLTSATAAGALGSGFWGLLFGLIVFVPLLGAAIGAPSGAMAGALADVGIDDTFINQVRDGVTPGTSALFVLTADTAVDHVRHALAEQLRAELISTTVSAEQEAALRDVFAD